MGRSVTVGQPMLATIYHEGRSIDIHVEYNARAKRIRLKVGRSSRRIVLVLPRSVSVKRGLAFAQSKADWAVRQLALLPEKQVFQDGLSFSFLGRESVIHHSPSAKRGVWFDENVLWVSGQSEHLARRVRDFIKKEFSAYALQKARKTAEQIQVHVQRVTVRDTTSRWGSCSRTGHLSFSWRLALAPLFVADYVIAHEVAHLRQMNHSAAFWQVVEELAPDYQRAEKWLKKNAAYLYSFAAKETD
ncbi:MAG: M48 family metallopeptidase [Alphaproteobacteria bacterium]|nr:M48 family metallopeptidase [Alphaproteobacteria bacterium]